MITLVNVNLCINKCILLQNISYTFIAGRIYHLKGKNGSGKTSLIEGVLGLNTFLIGQIENSFKTYSYLPQSSVSLPKMNLKLGDISNTEYSFYKKEFFDKSWNKASGGERKRALLARHFDANTELYLLDEPFNHLDLETQQLVWFELLERKTKGATLILTGHVETNEPLEEVEVSQWN